MLGLQWYIGGLTWMQNSIVESKERDFVTTTTSIFMRERLLGSEKNLNFLVATSFLDAGWSCANSKMGAKSLE